MMPLSATTERTRLNRFVRTGAKQTQNHITHAAETRNCAQTLRWMPRQGTSRQKRVDRDAKQRQSEREGTPLGKCQMKLIFMVAGIVVTFVAGAEAIARYGIGLGTPPLSMPHPAVEYIFQPDQDVSRFGNRQLYNAHSMRSPDLPDPSQEGIVLVMGDSVLNGGNLTSHADLATSIASERDSERFYANVSAGSWGPGNLRGYLDTYGTFGAEAVIIVFNGGDVQDIPEYGPLDPAPHPQERPIWAVGEGLVRYAPRYLPEPFAGWLRPQPVPNTYPKPANMPDGIMETQRMLDRFANEGIAACFVLHRSRDKMPDSDDVGLARFRDLAQAVSVPTLETRPAFDATGQNISMFYRDPIHITVQGQAVLADLLLTCRDLASVPKPGG